MSTLLQQIASEGNTRTQKSCVHQKSLTLYHGLPWLVRSLVASVRGFRLRWQRFGAETDRLVGEALQRRAAPVPLICAIPPNLSP